MTATIIEKARTEFGTREGTNREKVLVQLYAQKGKPVSLSAVAKKVYGKGDEANRLKVKATIVGLNMMIADGKLPYQPVTFEGIGEEATFALVGKKKRAS